MSTFPSTRGSLVESLRSTDETVRTRALELVARVYREPILAVVRHRWALPTADAEDLVHDFLLQAFEKDWLVRYDASRGRFRTFLRACLIAFVSTRAESANRLKRGGGAIHIAIDAIELPAPPDDALDALFEQEWTRSVLTTAIELLRSECESAGRRLTFDVFVAHDIAGAESDVAPGYAALAARFGIPVTQVSNFLNWARRRMRSHVLDTLRALTTSDAEFRAEARALLGVVIR